MTEQHITQLFSVSWDEDRGESIIQRVHDRGVSGSQPNLKIEDPEIQRMIFGAGTIRTPTVRGRTIHVTPITAAPPRHSTDPGCDLAVALADGVMSADGVLEIELFDRIFAVGNLEPDDAEPSWSLPADTATALRLCLEQLDHYPEHERVLVVAPRAATGIFRDLCVRRADARIIRTPSDLNQQDALADGMVDARITLLPLRHSMMHFRSLCHILREHQPRRRQTQPRLELPPPPPRVPTMLEPLSPSGESTAVSPRGRGADTLQSSSIAGRYTLLSELGEGGFATVYRARDQQMRRDVAIKILSPELLTRKSTREQFLKRFEHEVAICASLDHPHLVPVYDTGSLAEDELERPFLVMKLLEGHDLEARLASGALEPGLVHVLGLQALDALSHTHARGIVHKDLKPANLFLSSVNDAPHIYIMDFGIAFDPRPGMGRVTHTGAFAGTIQYLSPEYILEQRKDPSPALDVFQMGLILAELLTGHPIVPHETTLPELIGRYIQKKQPELPSHLKGTAAGDVLSAAIAFDPADRFPDARAFKRAWAALDPAEFPILSPNPMQRTAPTSEQLLPGGALPDTLILTEDGSTAPPATPLNQQVATSQPPPRGRKLLWIAAVAAVAVMGVLTAVSFSGGQAQGPAPSKPAAPLQVSAPAAPPVEDMSEAEAPPEQVIITSAPMNGARVLWEGEEVGETPLHIQRDTIDAPRVYLIKHPEHGQGAVTLNPATLKSEYTVILTPAPASAPTEAKVTKRKLKRRARPDKKTRQDTQIKQQGTSKATPPKDNKPRTTLPPI